MKYVPFLIATTLFTVLFAMFSFYPISPSQSKAVSGPIIYGITPGGVIYKIDVMTCEACPILNATGFLGVADLVVLPDGNILVQSEDGLRLYNPPNPNPIWSDNADYLGSILVPNGLVYLSSGGSTPGLWSFDPATNTTILIGNWPPNIIVSEFFYQGGVLYGVAREGPPPFVSRIIEVNVTNPGQSAIVVPNSPLSLGGGTTNNGYTTMIVVNGSSSGNILTQYDVSTNTFITLCTLPQGMLGLSDLPAGVTEEPCLCSTFAGTVNAITFNVCIPGSIAVPYNNNATLDANDILRYILFSDPNDTLGSIIVQSSTVNINYDPATMQTGVPYYLATLAGNNAGGNVNLSDPCLDVSNTAAQVTWRPNPTVVFSTPNPNVCAGACTDVTATFTGTPPFVLTYTSPVTGIVTQTFSGYSGTFQVCTLPGSPPGSFLIAATAITDAWCSCN
jgi:hypothetical protein